MLRSVDIIFFVHFFCLRPSIVSPSLSMALSWPLNVSNMRFGKSFRMKKYITYTDFERTKYDGFSITRCFSDVWSRLLNERRSRRKQKTFTMRNNCYALNGEKLFKHSAATTLDHSSNQFLKSCNSSHWQKSWIMVWKVRLFMWCVWCWCCCCSCVGSSQTLNSKGKMSDECQVTTLMTLEIIVSSYLIGLDRTEPFEPKKYQ